SSRAEDDITLVVARRHKRPRNQAIRKDDRCQGRKTNGGPTRTRTWDQRIMSSGKPVDSQGNQQVKSADREQVRQNPQPGRNQISDLTGRDDDDDSKKEESD